MSCKKNTKNLDAAFYNEFSAREPRLSTINSEMPFNPLFVCACPLFDNFHKANKARNKGAGAPIINSIISTVLPFSGTDSHNLMAAILKGFTVVKSYVRACMCVSHNFVSVGFIAS